MADKTFHVEIVTPRSQVFSGEASMVTLPGVMGPFQVLYNHAPILTELEIGDIRIVGDGQREHHFATSGGFMEMNNNRLTVIAETVESAEAINAERAESARQRADERIHEGRREHNKEIDMVRAEAALARATNRLKVAVSAKTVRV
ncbi:MAG: F0F1 ATP synthase subunit epsilon [Candidatus Kapaibacterium sp.]